MAKDPAFLFYPGDWQGGTATLSRYLKGCYMDVLIAQFNSGPLSIEEIKTVLGADFAAWGTLSKKFKKTDNGLFFNERLESEKEKRQKYSLSRRENINKRYDELKPKSTYVDTHVVHMNLHMENENISSINNKIIIKGDSTHVATYVELRKKVEDFIMANPNKYPKEMYEKFISYWTEKNAKGKERWKTEKFFEVPRRLSTWHSNQSNFGSNKFSTPSGPKKMVL